MFSCQYSNFLKIGLSKMYPYFKLLIFGYISRFLTKFSTLLGFFYALNTNPPLVFVLDLGNMVKKWFTKRYHTIGKAPFWVLTSYGVKISIFRKVFQSG